MLTLSGSLRNTVASSNYSFTFYGAGNGLVSGVLQNGSTSALTSVNVQGPGQWTLSGSNTYSGNTTINGGSLVAASANVLSSSSAVLVNGGSLDVTSSPQTIASLTMSSPGNLNVSIGNLLTVSNMSALTGNLNIYGTTSGSIELIALPGGYGGTQFSSYNFMNGLIGYALSYQSNQIDLVASAVGSAIWSSTAGGSWNTPGNWSTSAVPTGQGVLAIMGTVPTTATAVSLDSTQTVGLLIFNNTAGYTLTPGSAGSLTLDNTGGIGDASVVVLSGSHSILAPLTLAGGNTAVSLTGNGSLNISGNIGDVAGVSALILSSSDNTGLLTLSGTNSFGGGTFVNTGTLILNGASSLFAGSTLTIGVNPSPGAVFSTPLAISPTPVAATQLAPVPEPGTFALLAIAALAGLGIWRRRVGG